MGNSKKVGVSELAVDLIHKLIILYVAPCCSGLHR